LSGQILVLISFVFNLFGLYFISNDSFSYIIKYSPLAIIAMSIAVFLYEKKPSWKLLRTVFAIFIFTLFIEVFGVSSSMPFGDYFYGNNLGFKIFDVPLVIGLNWVTVLYLSLNFASIFNFSKTRTAIFSSLLMLMLDFTIEPICSKLDFWYWSNGSAGFANYFAWFAIALLLNSFYLSRHELKTNYVALFHYFIYLAFFVSLNFIV
jgi:uncharacterized membrane protein